MKSAGEFALIWRLLHNEPPSLSNIPFRFNFYLRLTLEIVSGEIKRKKEEIKEENYAVI